MRANNNHSHLAIKNFVKPLILVMFLTLFAKMTKKRGKVREGEVKEAEESKPASTPAIKKKKRSAKITLPFARSGKMLTTLYIYNIIYNII